MLAWRGDLGHIMTPSGGQLPHSDWGTSFQLRVRDDCIRLTLLMRSSCCGSRRAGSFPSTVSVAQLVERWIVAPVVVGSIPITHPNFFNNFRISVDDLIPGARECQLPCLAARRAVSPLFGSPHGS